MPRRLNLNLYPIVVIDSPIDGTLVLRRGTELQLENFIKWYEAQFSSYSPGHSTSFKVVGYWGVQSGNSWRPEAVAAVEDLGKTHFIYRENVWKPRSEGFVYRSLPTTNINQNLAVSILADIFGGEVSKDKYDIVTISFPICPIARENNVF